VRPRLAAVVGVGLAIAALSVHEMESTVFVLPPGMSNLAQQLLDYLHYARDEQLSAAAINLLGSGVVIALVAGWLVARGLWSSERIAPRR
jgi:ABC-type spermidine/putrescine transport system permease subunit II